MPTIGQTKLENPFDFFDSIFLINLDERKDRLEESLNEFRKYDIVLNNFYRFPAIKLKGNHPLIGRAGCALSHRSILDIAKNNNLKRVLILEDDFSFMTNPIKTLQKGVKFLNENDWGLFYLGQTTTSEIFEKPLELVQEGVLRLRGGLTTHSISYNNCIYDKILNEIPGEVDKIIPWLMLNESIDGWILRNIQAKDDFKCFTADPMVCIQRASFSDIDNKFADYSENIVKAFNNERAKI
jgi:hypothetical protein